MTVAVEPKVTAAALWRLLSLGFTSPTEETLAEIEAIAAALAEVGDDTDVEELLTAIRYSSIDALMSQYQALFGGSVLVSPYEGSYELDPIRQGRQIADVAAFYRAFGAAAHGPAAERPDHVGCELEFLAFLELRRLTAAEERDEPGTTVVDEIAATFLEDHAGRWLPTFFAGVYDVSANAPVYRALALLGRRMLDAELERRGLEPPPLPRRSGRLSVERDSFDCAP